MFFSMDELPTASLEGKSDLAPRIYNCARCGLFSTCHTPKIPASGQGKRRILVIGDVVSAIEDNTGNEKHGSTYAYLKRHFKQCGIDLEEDCWYTHAIRCHTKSELTITAQSACHRMLMEEIEALDPVVIIPTCPEALDILLYERMVGRAAMAKYSDWCGEVIPDQVLRRWICPIYSPRFVEERDEKRINPYILHWHNHIIAACDHRKKPTDIPVGISICDTLGKAMAAIKHAREWKRFAFDYETTGIKPYRKGHRIAYVSFSDGVDAYAMPHYDDPEYLSQLRGLLTNDAKKIAHNANFERSWTRNILKYEVKNLVHDTMLLQHAYNNRKPTGLKFCVYANYGYLGYDADADEYLKADKEEVMKYGSNAFNRVFDAPAKKMLTYNAMDSAFTAWLFDDIYPRLDPVAQKPGYHLFMDASIALADCHEEGFDIDVEKMNNVSIEIEKAIKPYIDQIMNDPIIVGQWSSGHKFNPKSDYDIRMLLFKILKLEPIEFTDKGQPSVDAEALEEYRKEVPIIEPLYEVKRLSKLHGTYIRQMRAEQNEGKIQCFFNLNRVVTYRSSSDSPNLQNCFSDDTEILTRTGWKYFYDLNEKDQVAEYNTSNDTISFTVPSRIIKNRHQGKLLNIRTNTYIDMLVTEEHECLVQRRETGAWLKVPASEYPANYLQKVSASVRGGKRVYTDEWIQFIVALQADGHVTEYGIELGFKKQRKVERMKHILDACNLSYSVYHKKNGEVRYYVPYNKNKILLDMRKWKYFDESILAWDVGSLNTFIKEMGEWDGCSYNTRSLMYLSKIEKNVDIVQAVCVLTGNQSKKRYYKNARGEYAVVDILLGKSTVHTANCIKQEAEYDGYVYCVTVPSGNIVVRRNGKVAITGNCPKRDKKSKEIIRSLYYPKPGHYLKEIDFKGAEVSTAAAVTGDKNLIKYVSDTSTDMHRDLARSIFMVDDVSKNLRGVATKGPFTFAEFYGSYYEQVARGIWKEIDIPNAVDFYGFDVVRHLKKCGVRTYDSWVKHIQEQERILWEDFFPEYQRWREDTYSFFVENGYIDYPNGFRYWGPASRNECLNAPIQGPAFHINLWALTNINRELREKEFRSSLICQIHDSQIYDMDPKEEGIVSKICYKWIVEKSREHWPWITVPLMAEVENGEIDQPWSSMKGAGFLEG